jgi:hypothetical protein
MRIRRSLQASIAIAGVCFLALSGCRGTTERQWEIIAQNQSDTSCEVAVNIGPDPGANAPDLGKGERRVLLSGSEKVVVCAVKVVHNRVQQVFCPRVEVPAGKSFLIRVQADGQAVTSVLDQ